MGTVQYIDQPFWPLNTTLWVKDFKGNMPRYVYYYLQTLDLNRFNSGTGVPTLNRNDLDSLEIIIHNPEGQTKVATILATYDDLIENNNRRIKILEEMAQMIYREWFVHFRFPGHEKVKMVDSSVSKIPEGWSHSCIGDLATEKRNTVNPEDLNPTTPYVGLEHIPRRAITLDKWGTASDAHSTKYKFKRGDILFGKIRPYFHKVVFAPEEGISSTDTIVISASDDKYFPLLLMLTSSETFVDYASQTSQGTKMPRANWGVLKKYPIIIPEKSLLGRFNALTKYFINLIDVLANQNRALKTTRDLLLPKLISGDLEVENQDINIGDVV